METQMKDNKPCEGKASATVFLEDRVSNTVLSRLLTVHRRKTVLGNEPVTDRPTQAQLHYSAWYPMGSPRHFLFLVTVVRKEQALSRGTPPLCNTGCLRSVDQSLF